MMCAHTSNDTNREFPIENVKCVRVLTMCGIGTSLELKNGIIVKNVLLF